MRSSWVALLAGVFVAACSQSDSTKDDGAPFFPADYAESYVEVRSCQPSGDHNLNNVRVLAVARAQRAYVQRDTPFAEGDIVLKEEHDFADSNCTGDIRQWTVMKRTGAPDGPLLGWRWQRVDAFGRVTESDAPKCYGCHAGCGVAPDGFEGTCGKQ